MKRIVLILAVLMLILTVNVVFAENETDSLVEDIYVSVNGSDSLGDGSKINPFQTLNYTIDRASNNSKIYLESGTYESTGYEITNKSLSITGIGEVTIDGGNGKLSQNIFKVNNHSSLVLSNIRFINGYADLEGSLSPIINEGELKISNCNFYNFTTINGVIFNKNLLNIDKVSVSKSVVDWKSVYGDAGSIGFAGWIAEQIRDNPSRGEFITNIGHAVIYNSNFYSTVYNNRIMSITNSYLSAFVSNRSYDFDIKSIIDRSKVMSLRVSQNSLLVVNNSFVDPQYDELWYTNAVIQNSTFFNESSYYSFHTNYCNVSIKSSSFNRNVYFEFSNANVTHSFILGSLSTGLDSNVNANYNWWGDNRGPRIYNNPYSKLVSKYWIVMALDVVDNIVSVDLVKYTNGQTVWDLPNLNDVIPRPVKLEIEMGRFSKNHGYLENGTFKSKLIGDDLNTILFAKVDNQLLRFVVGNGFTNYIWYVSNDTGNDYFCDGSYENPFKTLSKAVSMSFNGNTIYVMEGIYTLSWNANLKISKELSFVGLGNAVLSRPNARNIFIVDEKGILNIDNINFTTFNSGYADPLIYLTGGEINVRNSNFYDTPIIHGIILAEDADLINLDNVTFNNFMGAAIRGNSSYICINNTQFSDEGSNYAISCVIDVKSDLDIFNSRFENIHDGLISINQKGHYLATPLNIYIYNTTFANNNWQNRAQFGLEIGVGKYNNRRYAVLDSCTFYNNVNGHLVFCNVINNCTFINNTDVPLKDKYPSNYHSYWQSLIEAHDLINNSYFYGNSLPSKSYEEHVIYCPNVYNSVFIKNSGAYGTLSDPKEVHYCVFINNTGVYGADDIFVYKGDLNASSNWWGSNQKPDASKVQVFVGNLTLDDWVILNLTQEGDKIIASLDNLVDDNKHIFRLNHSLPSRIAIFITDNGEITPNAISLKDNYAVAVLVKNTTDDFDVYVVVDNQKLSLTVYNNSTLILMDDVTLYGKDNKYKITLINVNGHKISNQLLDIIVKSSNGFMQPYTLTTDDFGVAYLNVDYSIGMYDVEAIYYGNGYFERSYSKALINVSSIATSIYSHDYTYWGKNNRFYAILSDESGRHLLNQSIVLKVFDMKGKLLTSTEIMTGTQGLAETLLSLDVGSYKIKWEFSGNEWYGKSSTISLITVKPINTTLTLPNATFYGRGNDYEFTFTDIYGNRISDETITLRISNSTDSKDFKIMVSNGVGSININLLPGIYDLEANYPGDDIYGSANVKAVLDIQKVLVTFDCKSYSTIPENGVFTVILKDMYGKKVSGQNLTLDLYQDGFYKDYSAVSDANGEANFKIDAVENIYFAMINFGGSIWYSPAAGAATIDVSHSVGIGEVYLNASDYVAYYGENKYFTIMFNDTNKFSLEGIKIPVIISSVDFSKAFDVESDAFGNVRLQITLEPGSYDVNYKYVNEFYNIHDSKTNKITIFKMPTDLIVSDMILKRGDTRSFEVKLVNKNGVSISNLPVEIRIGGKAVNVSTNAFGVARLPIDLELGYHSVECVFDNANYVSSSANATILVVDDSKTITSIESSEIYGSEDDLINYNVTLLDILGNPIKSSQIILNITDDEGNFIGSHEAYTDIKGVAIFTLNLSYGDYQARTFYGGNNLYFESFNTNNIYVSPQENVTETILYGSDVDIINGYDNAYSVVLRTVEGEFICNASIEFIVKGHSYFACTDEAGRAYLDAHFKPGAYEVKARFAGSNNLSKAYVNNYIRVSGELIYMYSQDVVKSFNNGTHYYIALFDALGKAMSGKIIKFVFENNTYENITDENGFACFELWLSPGSYNITAIYEGNYPDEYVCLSNNITVLTTISSENLTGYYDGNSLLFAAFSDFKAEGLNNSNVIFNIGGINYKVKTDEYGFAILDIDLKAGNYNLTLLNTLTGQIGVYNVKILSTVISSNLVKYYKGSEKFKATFKDKNGNLLKNAKVKFIVKGKTYTVKTDSKGIASLSVNLKPGTYSIVTLNTKTSERHANKIIVKKTIITGNKKVKSNKKINFQAKILKINGKIAKKVTVKFKINKKTYKVKTNSKGIAKLNIKLKKGTYTITTSYKGLSVKNKVRCS